MRDNFTYVGSAYLFLIKDNRVLLQRRYNTGFQDGNYGVPSGHMDGGETARQACAREMKEEIGITINPEDLEIVHTMHRKGDLDERIDFFMTTSIYEGEIINCEPNKCDDLRWFALEDLPENMVEYVQIALGHHLKKVPYSEYGWKNNEGT